MPHQLTALPPTLKELRAVVPVLSGELQPYFTRLLLALQAIEQRTGLVGPALIGPDVTN